MSADELRELDGAELAVKERDLRGQLFKLRFQVNMGQVDGLKKYRALKKDLARLLTVRVQRETGVAKG
jgi:large subunit ribosomal protein L29